MDRIKDKIIEIEKFLEELESVLPKDLEEYLRDWKTKAICERYFEKIIEAAVDLTFLIIKEKELKIPKDDESSFIVLSDNKLVSEELVLKLKNAKGMRNIIAQEYGKIDDELVFEAVTEQLGKDVRAFLGVIGRLK